MKICSFRKVKIGSTFYIDQDINKKYIKLDSKGSFGYKGKVEFPPSFKVFLPESIFNER